MTLGDFKLYTINTFALGVTTFTKIEMGLKILLLIGVFSLVFIDTSLIIDQVINTLKTVN